VYFLVLNMVFTPKENILLPEFLLDDVENPPSQRAYDATPRELKRTTELLKTIYWGRR